MKHNLIRSYLYLGNSTKMIPAAARESEIPFMPLSNLLKSASGTYPSGTCPFCHQRRSS